MEALDHSESWWAGDHRYVLPLLVSFQNVLRRHSKLPVDTTMLLNTRWTKPRPDYMGIESGLQSRSKWSGSLKAATGEQLSVERRDRTLERPGELAFESLL
jgi:hypothetical protein